MSWFWYCFDDHLAAWLDMPKLGEVPWWVILLVWIFIEGGIFGSRTVYVKTRD